MSQAKPDDNYEDPTFDLHMAVYKGDFSAVRMALLGGTPIDEQHILTKMTPLHIAVGTDNITIARYLVQFGAKFTPDPEGRMPSLIAADCLASNDMCDFIADAETAANASGQVNLEFLQSAHLLNDEQLLEMKQQAAKEYLELNRNIEEVQERLKRFLIPSQAPDDQVREVLDLLNLLRKGNRIVADDDLNAPLMALLRQGNTQEALTLFKSYLTELAIELEKAKSTLRLLGNKFYPTEDSSDEGTEVLREAAIEIVKIDKDTTGENPVHDDDNTEL